MSVCTNFKDRPGYRRTCTCTNFLEVADSKKKKPSFTYLTQNNMKLACKKLCVLYNDRKKLIFKRMTDDFISL